MTAAFPRAGAALLLAALGSGVAAAPRLPHGAGHRSRGLAARVGLVALFSAALPATCSYGFVYPASASPTRALRLAEAWIEDEFEKQVTV